ncbi:MAG: hypothetical protein QXF26_05080, partial [Candidatus Bathyarchaeia archaeon]
AVAMPSYHDVPPLLLARVLNLPILFAFFNAAVFSALYPAVIFLLNLRDRLQGKPLLEGLEVGSWFTRALLYASTRRVGLERLQGSLKYFPAEEVAFEDRKPIRKPVLFVGAGKDFDKSLSILKAHSQLFEGGVLASPTVPMVAFITLGFLSTVMLVSFPFRIV